MAKFNLPHVSITVNNVEKTKEFYKKIGFKLLEEVYEKKKKRFTLMFEGYGLEIEVFHFEEADNSRKETLDFLSPGITHFAVPVKDLEKVRDRFKRKEVKISKDITESSLGVKYMFVEDPCGITVEFFEKL